MIKVGDKLLIKDEVYVIQNESYNDNKVEAKCTSEFKFVEMEFGTALGYAFAYEKQRADVTEKKWEKLKESVKQLEKDINKWYYDSEDVLQELFDIMIKIERGGE